MNGKKMRLAAAIALTALPLVAWGQTRGFSDVEKAPDPSAAPGGVFRALLIGNDKYEADKWPKLKTAGKDIDDMAKILITRYGFSPENVRVMKNANRRDMLRGLIDLEKGSGANDSVVIYYAGHGEFDKNERGWWVPVDARDSEDYISNEDILARLRAIKVRHKLLISDSCFSGNLLTRGARAEVSPDTPMKGYFLEKHKLASVQGLSSGGNEPVSDGGPEWNGNSIFAYHLIGALKANQKRYFSATLLGYQLAERVANDTASVMGAGQTPVFSSVKNQGDQGGEFFFIPTDLAPEARVRVAVFDAPPASEQAANEPLAKARETVRQDLLQQMKSQNLDSVGAISLLPAKNREAALLSRMKESGAQAAVVIVLEGSRRPDDTLLWKGVSTLRVTLEGFRLEKDRLTRLSVVEMEPQALPMRKWSEEPTEIEAEYGHTADKLVKKWARPRLTQFFSEFQSE